MNIDKSIKINGRINNSGNENIVKIWHSKIPSTAFFFTVFNLNPRCNISAENIFNLFPDSIFVVLGYCLQEVMHFHMVVCLMNEYERKIIKRRIKKYLEGFSPEIKLLICPIYKGIVPCVRYIYWQVIIMNKIRLIDIYSLIDIDEFWKMKYIGNTWWKVLVGDENLGVSKKMLKRWCECGYPPYAYTYSFPFNNYIYASRNGILTFYKNLFINKMSRKYYNENVNVIPYIAKDAGNAYDLLMENMKEYYGNSRAIIPFVIDIRNILGAFTEKAFPNYLCEPAIILFISDNMLDIEAQRETIRCIIERRGLFANVEVLCLIFNSETPELEDFNKVFNL